MRRATMLCGLIAVGALAVGLRAFQPPAQQGPKVVEVEKVKDNLFMLKGGGGNTAVFVGTNGVIVVDAKNPGWGQPILDKIKELTPKPVTLLINTHTHGDHVSGDVEFPATVDIVVQENTKTNMEKMDDFKGDKAKFLPKKTFKDKMTLGKGKDEIDLYYFGRGHTGGDTIIVFPALRVAHTGDLFAAKGTPLIDVNNGGSGVEYPRTLKRAAEGIKGVDVVIPGHSAVTDWKAFQEYGDFNQDFLSAVQRAFKEGKTAEEAAGSLKLPDQYKDYGTRSLKDNVTKIYAELKQ